MATLLRNLNVAANTSTVISASHALNSNNSVSALNSLTASYTTTAITASYAVSAETATTALTASYIIGGGSNGSNGTSGTSGAAGASGAAGTSGTSGVSGASGAAGTDGSSGTSGVSGTAGTSGASGAAGADGSSGTSGASGAAGSSGTSGASGAAGSSGTSGASGAAGSSGTSGSAGTSGTTGASGSSGTSGSAGTSGSSGANGSSGTSGTAGSSGNSVSVTTSDTAPINPSTGSLWWDTTTGDLKVYYFNVTGSWVAASSAVSGTAGTSGSSGTSGTTGTSGSSGTAGSAGTAGSSGTSGYTPTNMVSSSAQLSNGGGIAFDSNNNITVGQITASFAKITNLTVEYVTSSVMIITGSNKFGDASNDKQEFTGSVSMSGSLSVTGTLSATGIASFIGLKAQKATATSGFISAIDEGANVYNVLGSRNNADNAYLPMVIRGTTVTLGATSDIATISSTGLAVTGTLSATGALSITATAASSISRTLSVGALIASGNLNGLGFVPNSTGLSAGYNYSGGDAETNMIFGASSSSQQMRFQRWDGTTLTNVLTLTGAGNVGIGMTPSALLQVANTGRALAVLRILQSNQTAPFTETFTAANDGGGASPFIYSGQPGGSFPFDAYGELVIQGNPRAGYNNGISFVTGTGSSQAVVARISGNGLGIGTTSPNCRLHVASSGVMSSSGYNGQSSTLQIAFTGTGSAINSDGPSLVFSQQYDSTDPTSYVRTGAIYGYKGEANGNFGGGLKFRTQPTGANAMADVMTLDKNGNVGIGTVSPAAKLHISGTSAGIILDRVSTDVDPSGIQGSIYVKENGISNYEAMLFRATGYRWQSDAGTDYMLINSSGNVSIGTTGAGGKLVVTQTASSTNAILVDISSSTTKFAEFTFTGSNVGSISYNGSNTVYATTSDYRLKDLTGPLTDSGAFIDSLKPKVGTWKSNGSKFVGFVAHEFAEVSPTSVCGEKDAVDAEGKPVYQAMQASSAEVIANMVAELQSLRTRNASIEARLAALESK